MAAFLVIAPAPEPRLEAAVKSAFPHDHFVIASAQFLVFDDKATTPEIADKLGVLGGGMGRVLITPVQNYTGWHNKDLWEWLASRSGGMAPPAARIG